MQDREILYFLQTLNGIGDITTNRLWEYFGDWNRVFDASERELQPLLKPSQLRTFLREREKRNLVEELKCLEQRGIFYYSKMDEKYPNRLKCITDAPNGIFVRGKLPKEDGLSIAIVGTRRHSYYGEKQTKQFSRIIAERGIPVISGMARGIDGIAQKTAIEYGGDTYAILGCGVDICYPEEHKHLAEEIVQHGGIISEYPPGTVPAPGLFPRRNRIISALCDVLLVMEAREKSGTLITVDMALEQGKEIWVLPGRVDDALSSGCNRLIAQGAGILPGVDEFEKELEEWCEKYGEGKVNQKDDLFTHEGEVTDIDEQKQIGKGMTLIEKSVAASLDYQPLSLTSIYERMDMESRTRYTIQQVSIALMDLCMRKIAKQTGANYYIRC